jgi:hypothetical protein
VRTVASSSRVAVVQTDAGAAYLKAINNPWGPNVLACDWLGTQLARRFGLQTFDVAILELTDLDEVQIDEGVMATSGPTLIARAEEGSPMGGQKALNSVENIEDIPRLIVFDTWVRNCDRYAPGLGHEGGPRMNSDNLFLSAEDAPKGKFILKAIDHGHIFSCGHRLTNRLAEINNIKEERLYGLFPFFQPYVTTEQLEEVAKELSRVRSDLWKDLLDSIPDKWDVSAEARRAIDKFLLERARFLADNLRALAHRELQPDTLDFGLIKEGDDG